MKRNIRFFILLVAATLCAVVILTSCDFSQVSGSASATASSTSPSTQVSPSSEPSVDNLKINSFKSTYSVGDTSAFVSVSADGKSVKVTKEMLSGFDTTTVGIRTVKVNYGGKEAVFEITVLPKSESYADQMAGVTQTQLDLTEEDLSRITEIYVAIVCGATQTNAYKNRYQSFYNLHYPKIAALFAADGDLTVALEKSGIPREKFDEMLVFLETHAETLHTIVEDIDEFNLKYDLSFSNGSSLLKLAVGKENTAVIVSLLEEFSKVFDINSIGTLWYQYAAAHQDRNILANTSYEEIVLAAEENNIANAFSRMIFRETAVPLPTRLQCVSAVKSIYSILSDADKIDFEKIGVAYSALQNAGIFENNFEDFKRNPKEALGRLSITEIVDVINAAGEILSVVSDNLEDETLKIFAGFKEYVSKIAEYFPFGLELFDTAKLLESKGFVKLVGRIAKDLTIDKLAVISADYQAWKNKESAGEDSSAEFARFVVRICRLYRSNYNQLSTDETKEFFEIANYILYEIFGISYDYSNFLRQALNFGALNANALSASDVKAIGDAFTKLLSTDISCLVPAKNYKIPEDEYLRFEVGKPIDKAVVADYCNNYLELATHTGTIGDLYAGTLKFSYVTITEANVSSLSAAKAGKYVFTVSYENEDGKVYKIVLPYYVVDYSSQVIVSGTKVSINCAVNTDTVAYFNKETFVVLKGTEALEPADMAVTASCDFASAGYSYYDLCITPSRIICDFSKCGKFVGFAIYETVQVGEIAVPFEYYVVDDSNLYVHDLEVNGLSDIALTGVNLKNSGATLTAMVNGTQIIVPLSSDEVTLSGYNSSREGAQTVKITYKNMTVEKTIRFVSNAQRNTVTSCFCELNDFYAQGDILDKSKIFMTLVSGYGLGGIEKRAVDSISYDFSEAGWSYVNVVYGAYQYTAKVFVLPREEAESVTGIKNIKLESSYAVGETINMEEIALDVVFGYGYSMVEYNGNDTDLSGIVTLEYDFSAAGNATVKVSVGKALQFLTVTVYD